MTAAASEAPVTQSCRSEDRLDCLSDHRSPPGPHWAPHSTTNCWLTEPPAHPRPAERERGIRRRYRFVVPEPVARDQPANPR